MLTEKQPHGCYVLATAAYNEEKQIEQTIRCVLSQTVLPLRWFIVSDGSTDRTDTIIQHYAAQRSFIVYKRLEKTRSGLNKLENTSLAQSRAMALARENLKDLDYDFLGNLDADITFGSDYFEKIIDKINSDPELGIVGGGAYSVLKDGRPASGGFIQPDFVGGPIQFFRRKCLEDIGGYAPYGHSDSVAVFSARMKGWKVRCFPEIRAYHHGMPGNSIREKVPICFRLGYMDYIMGALPLFMAGRCAARMFQRPYILAGISMFSGYLGAALKSQKSLLPKDLKEFMQADQKRKIRDTFLLRF